MFVTFYRHNKSNGVYIRLNNFVYNANRNDDVCGEILYFSLQDHRIYRRSIESFEDIVAIPKGNILYATYRYTKLTKYETFKCIMKLIFTGGKKWQT